MTKLDSVQRECKENLIYNLRMTLVTPEGVMHGVDVRFDKDKLDLYDTFFAKYFLTPAFNTLIRNIKK
jgi:hypothetical protein